MYRAVLEKPQWKTWNERNPEKRKAFARQHYLQNKEKYLLATRRNTYFRKYGLTIEDYEELLQQQNGVCAICETDKPGTKDLHFCVDHNHETGRIRGLLCRRCNLLLGKALDSPELLHKAEVYLKQGGHK